MSVYVDDMRAAYGRMKMCHMIADSHDELMAMVVRIGVDPKWIQDAGTHREHFDIALSKRELAISAGAIPLNMRELAGITRARRPARPALTPSETAGPPECPDDPPCDECLEAREFAAPSPVSPSPAVGPQPEQSTDQGWTKKDQQQEPVPKGESSMRMRMRCEWCDRQCSGQFCTSACRSEARIHAPDPKPSLARAIRDLRWYANRLCKDKPERYEVYQTADNTDVRLSDAVRVVLDALHAATDSLAGASALAVDPSRSTPNAVAVAAVASPGDANGE